MEGGVVPGGVDSPRFARERIKDACCTLFLAPESCSSHEGPGQLKAMSTWRSRSDQQCGKKINQTKKVIFFF